MTLEFLVRFLAWSSVVNIGLLLLWFFVFLFGRGAVYEIQARWFGIDRDVMNAIHYGGMGLFKMGLWLFNLTPYLVLRALL